MTHFRSMLFSGWAVVLRTYLDMRGLVSYLVNTELVIARVLLGLEMLIQMMTPVLGLAYQELSC